MRLIFYYLVIPLVFSVAVSCWVFFNGYHNQANIIGLTVYGLIFYGGPFFLLGLAFYIFTVDKLFVHFAFWGGQLAFFRSRWFGCHLQIKRGCQFNGVRIGHCHWS